MPEYLIRWEQIVVQAENEEEAVEMLFNKMGDCVDESVEFISHEGEGENSL